MSWNELDELYACPLSRMSWNELDELDGMSWIVTTTPCFRCLDPASGDAPLKPAEPPPNPNRCVGEAGTG
jgi:hypothetical protein